MGADYAVGTGWRVDNSLSHFWPEDQAIYLNSLLTEQELLHAEHWPDARIDDIVEDMLRDSKSV